MEKTINFQLKLITQKTDQQTAQIIQKTFEKLFNTNPTLKPFVLVDVSKAK